MLVYTKVASRHYGDLDLHVGQLRALAGDTRPPPRCIRKTLFTFYLWRPALHRQPAESGHEFRQHGARLPVRDTDGSADQGISVGWLNAKSLRNKTDTVEELVRDRSSMC